MALGSAGGRLPVPLPSPVRARPRPFLACENPGAGHREGGRLTAAGPFYAPQGVRAGCTPLIPREFTFRKRSMIGSTTSDPIRLRQTV